jgi:hypothetical protein
MMELPEWSPEMSDGCTAAPDAGPWGDHRRCCVEHDRRYYYGGTKADRREADVAMRSCMVSRGMPAPFAWLYFGAVRVFGHPAGHRPGVSWAFGGGRFCYSRSSSR